MLRSKTEIHQARSYPAGIGFDARAIAVCIKTPSSVIDSLRGWVVGRMFVTLLFVATVFALGSPAVAWAQGSSGSAPGQVVERFQQADRNTDNIHIVLDREFNPFQLQNDIVAELPDTPKIGDIFIDPVRESRRSEPTPALGPWAEILSSGWIPKVILPPPPRPEPDPVEARQFQVANAELEQQQRLPVLVDAPVDPTIWEWLAAEATAALRALEKAQGSEYFRWIIGGTCAALLMVWLGFKALRFEAVLFGFEPFAGASLPDVAPAKKSTADSRARGEERIRGNVRRAALARADGIIKGRSLAGTTSSLRPSGGAFAASDEIDRSAGRSSAALMASRAERLKTLREL